MLHSRFTWDEYFMTMAYLVSMKSKDPSTRVGAVVVGPENEIRSTGYNGLPRGIMDRATRYEDREFKNLAINHAEENAVLHCARLGISVQGCRIYCPWIPCSRCAKSIIQAGITEVIYDPSFPGNYPEQQKDWEKSINVAHEILVEAGIIVRAFEGKLVKIEGLYKTEKYDIYNLEN